jgi:chromosomal replication initiator protein
MLNGKQLVISADRVPSALIGMEERLKSRLGCGIVADIRNGDYNFRLNVLKKKAYSMNSEFQNHVLEFLAQNIHSSIRELEGALNKLVMMRSLNSSRVIDIPFVREKLADMLTHNHEIRENAYVLSKKNIKFDDIDVKNITGSLQQSKVLSDDILNDKKNFIYEIQLKVAEHYELQVSDLISSSRVKKVVLPKQIAMFLARKMTGESLVEIAKQFGGKDHSTIIYGCNKIEEMIKNDSVLSEEVNKLMILLKK